MSVGENIKHFRETAKISVEKFASLVGLSQEDIQNIEAGHRAISFAEIQKICSTLDIPVDALLSGPQQSGPSHAPLPKPHKALTPKITPAAKQPKKTLSRSCVSTDTPTLPNTAAIPEPPRITRGWIKTAVDQDVKDKSNNPKIDPSIASNAERDPRTTSTQGSVVMDFNALQNLLDKMNE